MVQARTWRIHAVETAPTERFKLRKQMAAAAGKTSTASLSLLMETFGLEVEAVLSAMYATLGRRCVDWKMAH